MTANRIDENEWFVINKNFNGGFDIQYEYRAGDAVIFSTFEQGTDKNELLATCRAECENFLAQQ